MKILVVEDSEGDRRLVELAFEHTKVELDYAETVADARLKLSQAQYDVVLLDVHLPNGHGIRVVEQVRPLTRATLVVYTGHGDPEFGMKAIEAGADSFLVKDEVIESKIARNIMCALARDRREGAEKARRQEEIDALRERLGKLEESLATLLHVPSIHKEASEGKPA